MHQDDALVVVDKPGDLAVHPTANALHRTLTGWLKRSGIEQVVLAQVSEFFPAVPGAVIRGVQKVWSKVLPPVTVTATGVPGGTM